MSPSTDFCLVSPQLLLLLIFPITTCSQTGETDSAEPVARILGGEDCTTDDHPFAISIQTSFFSQHFCGGSLIHSRWVLTAAHCIVTHEPEDVIAVAGASKIGWEDSEANSQTRFVEKFVIHPKFNPNSLHSDVSLMYLSEKFDLNDHVKLIDLPEAGFTRSCSMGLVLGWGVQSMDEVEIHNGHLKCLNLSVIDTKKCSRLYGESFDSATICTLSRQGGKDACYGDSGGPLVCGNKIIGIVSKGRSCGLPNVPGVYVRIEHFLDFIHETMLRSTSSAVKTKRGKMKRIFGNLVVLVGLDVILAKLVLS